MTAAHPLLARLFQQAVEQRLVAAALGMLQGLLQIATTMEVHGRPAMQQRYLLRLVHGQALGQEIMQQRVVAIVAGVLVHRQHEQLAGGQVLQQQGRTGAIEHLVAQLAVEAFEDRAAEQEVMHLRRQALEHHMAEVVDYFRLAAVETLQRHGAETCISQ